MTEPELFEGPINGGIFFCGTSSENLAPSFASKRQRRPSVRLGEIGDQSSTLLHESLISRTKKWNDSSTKLSKTRPLTNLVNGGDTDTHETLEIYDPKNPSEVKNRDLLSFGYPRLKNLKSKKGLMMKRLRSNWVSKVDEGEDRNGKFSGEEGGDEEGSAVSPPKEHSPDNPGVELRQNSYREHENEKEEIFSGQRRSIRARVSLSRDLDAVESDGVSMWLNGLGLARYVPVFEIHEVDEKVLPLLTLADLKDMGIYAVGSRRKMYCAIEKLQNGFL